MLRRYVFPCILIMAVSYATAGLAYLGAGSNLFRTNCAFQSLIRISQQLPQSKEAVEQYNRVAAKEVLVAAASGTVYSEAAKKLKVSEKTLQQAAAVGPIPSQTATFAVRVSISDPKRAVTFANETCDQFVAQIQKQRVAAIETDRKAVQKRIDAAEAEIKKLQKTPRAKRTSAQQAALISQVAILRANVQQLASLLSLPPDQISVLTRAKVARKEDNRNLSKNVLIALIAGLLACFLLVLVGEILAENRRRKIVSPTPDESG